MKKLVFLLVLCICFLLSCVQDQKPKVQSPLKSMVNLGEDIPKVTVMKLIEDQFNKELVSTGKIFAGRKAEIKFPIIETIAKILVKNGDVVTANQQLALLDKNDSKRKLERSKENLEKASVDLDDHLISFGYRLKDSLHIPNDIMRMAKVKTGFNRAQYDYQDAIQLLDKTVLKAPFSGKVADLDAKAYNPTEIYTKLCTIIDDINLEVEFSVLETEIILVKVGSKFEISPFGSLDQAVLGNILSINPIVDENGMIKVRGEVKNVKGLLVDGMSVKVKVRNSIPYKLIVPISAVVNRQDKQVIFTYKNGKAKWNYVELGMQNTKEFTINSGLNKGDLIIISNNLNLAHDAKVSLGESKFAY